MLICKNCNSENVDGAVKCVQCNMEGKLVPFGQQDITDFIVVEKSLTQCKNCGSEAPGKDDKCVHCHFPLPQSKPKPKAPQAPKRTQGNYGSFQPWEISNQKTG